MSTEILVPRFMAGQRETRGALVEGGAARKIRVQRASLHGLVHILHTGSVDCLLRGGPQ